MKSIKFSQLLKIVKPTYTYLKIIPDLSIRNYNSSNIAKAIHHMQKSISKRIRKEEKGLIFETLFKCSYMVDIFKQEVNFYFIVPKQYTSIAKEKIRETWARCTIDEIASIQPFSKEALLHEMVYKKEDPLSLTIDKKNNEPLNNILNTINVMEDKDRVSIIYNFIPTNQFSWRAEYDSTIDKIKHRQPIEKQKLSTKYISKYVLTSLIGLIDSIMEVVFDFLGSPKKEKDNQMSLLDLAITTLNVDKDLSPATKKKRDTTVLNTQLLVVSESDDKTRRNNNAVSVCQSFKSIDGDNELIYKKFNSKKPIDINTYSYPTQINRCSIDECANYIQLPGRELLQEYKFISQLKTLETSVPKELQDGTKKIGRVTYRGQNVNAYLTTDKDYKNLALAIIAPSRSGKTSLMQNLAVDCVNANECVIVLDYIETCQASTEIASCFKKEQVLKIDLSDYRNLPAFSYCEAITNSDDPLYIYDNLKRQANLLTYLINSVNVDNKELAPRMDRYLKAASHVVYATNGCTLDILNVLEDHVIREKYVNLVPETLKPYLTESISFLEQLDEWSKATKDNPSEKIGTHISYVSGILDRFYVLKGNTAIELMMGKKPSPNDLNFVNEMEKNQLIIISMPEKTFPSEPERDIAATYWITKLYLAGQVRADKIPDRYKRKTVNVFTDEINQLESAERFVGSRLDKTAKFGIKFIISAMYINQLRIRESLRNANTSYILISGADKVNYHELKDELSQSGYTLEDLMNLERYHSLNYIKYEKGYSAFITKLPSPIK
jgi:hypothetical protein